ncbi:MULTISPECIES: penicillin-binding protein activator [Pseudovibrio]|uniref:penicillin-binding protein activator n=1 Tax=Stappiaceae TaxID=2821832 RepID=UPI002365D26E|nr:MULTISPECIES: penicillin-binding protein activator [Pseudovibrio]MDD7909584.1 penicillin-binding protein activator [Pseudovibrio exalbescens]MDX5595063.1 penicillin-binding protein activator [Pseudovibrio sp. SPO723]
MSALQNASRGRFFKTTLKAVAVGAAALLAGCVAGPNYSNVYNPANSPFEPVGPAQVSGEVIGNGAVRVGLLLPMTGENQSSAEVATLFKNSAQMALQDFQGADIQLLVKDTRGTREGGQAAASAAIAEGAELILGPVFAQAVEGASSVARSAGVPVIGFSSDTNVAGRGTYLLSYLPESDVNRIVGYAADQERRSYSALLPNNSYGAVAEATFRQAVGRTNGRIVMVERYTPGDANDIRQKVTSLARSIGQVDTLFIPEGGGVPPFAMQVLTEQGANIGELKLIGSGQWNTRDILQSPVMVGSWFPGPDNRSFDQFSQRYASAFGQPPARNASLAYDATILAAGLVRSAGPDRFTDRVLTNKDGFLGIDGVFRFTSSGMSERGLAVYAVTSQGKAEPIAAAPRSFAPQF